MKMKTKAIVLAMALAGMMLPADAVAQQITRRPGGLFGIEDWSDREGLFQINNYYFEEDEEEDIENYGLGEEAPLGSGLFILLGAGLGYVALKKKED